MLDDSFPASDPPSWTGSISRVRPLEPRHVNDSLIRRVRAEFLEMPGLALTLAQAQRLWSMDRRTCEELLTSLTDSRFLHRTASRALRPARDTLLRSVTRAGSTRREHHRVVAVQRLRRRTEPRRSACASISLRARTTVPVGDIIFLLLVALAVGWVAVAAIRSHRRRLPQ